MFSTALQQRSENNSWVYPGYTAPFGVIVDLQLTAPESVGTELYVQRIYQNQSGYVSLSIADQNGTLVAYLNDCSTFDVPVLLESEIGIYGSVLLTQHLTKYGDLLTTDVRIHPSLISVYKQKVRTVQTLRLMVDGSAIFDSVLTTSMELKVSEDFSVELAGGTANIGINDPSVIEAYVTTPSSSVERQIKTINHIAPNSAGVVAITISQIASPSAQIYVHSSGSDINIKKVAYLDSSELNDALKRDDLINKYVSPNLNNRGYKYLPLDDAYYSATTPNHLGARETIRNFTDPGYTPLIGGQVNKTPDPNFDNQ